MLPADISNLVLANQRNPAMTLAVCGKHYYGIPRIVIEGLEPKYIIHGASFFLFVFLKNIIHAFLGGILRCILSSL